jgi:hypothetical protein
MTRLKYKGAIEQTGEFAALEARLQAALVPVTLRAGYAQELKHRLFQENELEVERPRTNPVQTVFLTAAGLLSGVLLVALGVRGLIALVNSIGGLPHMKNGITRKETAPAQPAV